MPNTQLTCRRILFNGALVLLVGLACGFLAITETPGTSMSWRAVHSALLMAGIWLLATGSAISHLVLDSRSMQALGWSLIAAAHGFMLTLIVQAITGVRGLEPGGSFAMLAAFAGNIVAVLAGLLAALLTLQGAYAALKTHEIA